MSRASAALGPLLLAGAAAAQADPGYQNVTTGGPLRPGIYGRIVLKGPHVPPPPVIHPEPRIASSALVPAGTKPVYLYVPPGQVRKWKRHCGKWKACDEPVLFVRVDHSPSRWGQWRRLRDQVALQERD